ncbi:MAG: RsmB/NOP family class I SAM-dependent RNA methyltransferase [Lachnospiraceae bacterium]|nr:RsmB/NOP family class I SAM-dependent RNA methyltransferase [Lachnospiraceae bacterium]
MKLSEEYKASMKEQLKEEYQAYEQSFAHPVHNGLRVNEAKLSSMEYRKISPWQFREIPWLDQEGYYYEDGCSPAKHPHYYAGLYYLQEPSAMTPAHILPVVPGDHVLDLCAAPGGKATQLGAKLHGQGFLLANDISNSRAKALLKNLELQGISNIFVTSEKPQKLCKTYESFFDKILLDAPCSGEGMFRKDPKMAAHWEQEGPEAYALRQKELLFEAWDMLKPGGMLLYSTCTFSVKENEEVIAALLEKQSDAVICIIPEYEGFAPGIAEQSHPELTRCVHIYPHRMEGEGHFLCMLKKQESTETRKHYETEANKPGSLTLPPEAKEFLSEVSMDFSEGYYYLLDQQLYFLKNDMKPQKGIRYLRTGLLLGKCEKKRFEPSQALAMALQSREYPACIRLKSEDERVVRYLKGETIDLGGVELLTGHTWQLVCVDGYPLGWGKLQNGCLKNKYYPGWRWQ